MSGIAWWEMSMLSVDVTTQVHILLVVGVLTAYM